MIDNNQFRMKEGIQTIYLGEDKIHLKKSFDGWRVVYPYRNEDGTLNWFNLLTGGSYFKLIVIVIVIAIILGFFWEYSYNLKLGIECMNKYNAEHISNFSNLLKNITLP